jgi:hypothetical protein
MRNEPYENEYTLIPTMQDDELLEYFLFRLAEMDEVWGLKDGSQWVNRQVDGRETLPVWPFKRFADDAAVGEWQNLKPVVESVEYFMFQILNKCALQERAIEIMPRPNAAGCLISPQRLFSFLEGMREGGECMVED